MTRSLTLGAQVCVLDSNNAVLLVRHGYHAGWHFPGGGVEFGENVVDAAIRELEEETGVVAREPPMLHGIFNNKAIFPGDHVVLYLLRAFDRPRIPAPSYEIVEQRFFPIGDLPDDVSAPTLRRLGEILRGDPIVAFW